MNLNLHKLEDSAVHTYIEKCKAASRNPKVDKFVKSLRSLSTRGATFLTQQDDFKDVKTNFKVNSMRLRDAQEITDQRRKYKFTAASNVLIKIPESDMSMFMGAIDQGWDKMVDRRERGVLWDIDVHISLSFKKRNRVCAIYLHSPEVKKLDTKLIHLSDHLEDKDEVSESPSMLTGKWYFFLEEQKRIKKKIIPRQFRHRNISIDGLFRVLIDEVSKLSHPLEGRVSGDPLVRFHLDMAHGVVTRMSHILDEDYRAIISTWLEDVVAFTEIRNRFWDYKSESYSIRAMHDTKPAPTPVHELFSNKEK